MTKNQIDYWNLQENKRSNLAVEKETNRHNVTTEYETNRHNVVSEKIDLGRLQEQTRHNLATEGISQGSLDESIRHNQAQEYLGTLNLGYNKDTLAEITRHNIATENLTNYDLSIRADQQAETVRHNVSTEGIQRYSAISQAELNTARANLTDIQSTWEGLKSSVHVTLSNAQIQQLNNLSDKLQSEMKEIEVKTKNQQYEGAFIIYEEFLRGLDSYSRAVDALIPG